ncbi:MAG: discoidin domain-containing protein [Verrucomicrobiota bacterium]
MAFKFFAGPRLRLSGIAFGLSALSPFLSAVAARPAWWAQRAVTNNQPADDHAVATLGQLKQFALKARAELEDSLPGGAGSAVNELIAGFGVNLTQLPGVTAAQSSTYGTAPNDAPASRAIDGKTDGNYTNGSVSHTAGDTATPWWQVDLGASRAIRTIEIWNRTDSHGSRTVKFYLLVSLSNMQGRTLASLLEDPAVWKSDKITQPPSPSLKVQVGNRAGQYVMVRLAADAPEPYLHLAEVKVRGVANPNAKPPDDLAVVTLGQLKAVAKPFYQRLIAVGYRNAYPWSNSVLPPADDAMACIGQVKRIFDFDPAFVDAAHDVNGNGVPDWWDLANLGPFPPLSNPTADSDGDGASNAQEATAGTDPVKKDNPAVQLSAYGFAAP